MSERRSLFKEADRPVRSTIVPTRKVSWFAGRVFDATYGIRHNPNSQTNILGRLMDLQPVMEGSRIEGLRLQFRLCERGKDGSVGQSEDREVRDLNLGPFDTVYQTPITARIQGGGDDDTRDLSVPLGNFENIYALIQEDRQPGAENRYLKIGFVIES